MGAGLALVTSLPVRSSVPTRKDRQDSPGLRMEAIKKKMQAMKVEKDNLCDRCDEVEQKCKEAHIRQEKAEEECTELTNEARTLEIDVEDEAKMKNLADELASAQKRAKEGRQAVRRGPEENAGCRGLPGGERREGRCQ